MIMVLTLNGNALLFAVNTTASNLQVGYKNMFLYSIQCKNANSIYMLNFAKHFCPVNLLLNQMNKISPEGYNTGYNIMFLTL